MKAIVAVEDLGQNRYQEHGRIRLGDRGGKNRAPRSLPTFRITSPDEEAIRQIAAIYGGEPRVWSDPKANPPDQWEVVTKATELRVFLPPGALSCWYEMWAGGGCVRRCDGRECEVAENSGDDAEMVKVPCLCKQENGMLCKPHTRLAVVLPEIRFGGVFRLETAGWQASRELPSMERLIASLQDHGVIEAVLALEKAQAKGGSRKFVVPRLRLSASALELAAGEASVGALHSGSSGMRALPAAPEVAEPGGVDVDGAVGVQRDWYDQDSEVVDAELVDEVVDGGVGDAGFPPPGDAASPSSKGLNKFQVRLVLSVKDAAEKCGVDEDLLRHALSRKASRGATSSSKELTPEAASQVIEWASEIADGLAVSVLSEDPPKVKLG